MSWKIDSYLAEDYSPSLAQYFDWNTFFYE